MPGLGLGFPVSRSPQGPASLGTTGIRKQLKLFIRNQLTLLTEIEMPFPPEMLSVSENDMREMHVKTPYCTFYKTHTSKNTGNNIKQIVKEYWLKGEYGGKVSSTLKVMSAGLIK